MPWPGSVLASCDKYIWGIPSLLPWIQPQFVLQYDWLVKNLEESFMPVYQLNYEVNATLRSTCIYLFIPVLLLESINLSLLILIKCRHRELGCVDNYVHIYTLEWADKESFRL